MTSLWFPVSSRAHITSAGILTTDAVQITDGADDVGVGCRVSGVGEAIDRAKESA